MKKLIILSLLLIVIGCSNTTKENNWRVDQTIHLWERPMRIHHPVQYCYDTIGWIYTASLDYDYTEYDYYIITRIVYGNDGWDADIGYISFVDVNSKDLDSMKCVEYNKAMIIIEDFIRFDQLDCNERSE